MHLVMAGDTVNQAHVAGVLGEYKAAAVGRLDEYIGEKAVDVNLMIAVTPKEAVGKPNAWRRKVRGAEKPNAVATVAKRA